MSPTQTFPTKGGWKRWPQTQPRDGLSAEPRTVSIGTSAVGTALRAFFSSAQPLGVWRLIKKFTFLGLLGTRPKIHLLMENDAGTITSTRIYVALGKKGTLGGAWVAQ